jgi:hypothetical protein
MTKTAKPIPRINPPRSLSTIANEILDDIKAGNWAAPSRAHAMPYLKAMVSLSSLDDCYYLDSGRSIVRYFLSNASTWRGPTAQRIKLELKGMLL